MVVEIPLTQGKVALVDDEDAARVLAMGRWHASPYSGGRWRASHAKKVDGHNVVVFMHRFLMDAPQGMDVDHINGDGLDNRRENLRLCTRAENLRNKRKYCGTSRYKGVFWHRYRHRWLAHIRLNRRNIYVGTFDNEEEAARAYDEAARKYHGEFATLNFPQEGERGALP